jgi:glycosyltransferase involved in cell wall biosynthesis
MRATAGGVTVAGAEGGQWRMGAAPAVASPTAPTIARRDDPRASTAASQALAPGAPEPSAAPFASLSVVIPVYNEEGNLAELYRRVTRVLTGLPLPFEIILVDDGSTDGTWHAIQSIAADPHVAAIRHRRNFGKARALANGFAAARGDVVITMDGDLQDDPDEIPRFLATLAEGYDLVSGWKQRRQDPLGKTLPSRLFNLTVSRVSGVPLHDFNCGFKAYRREVVRSIRLYGELHRFTPVLAHAEGFRIGELPVRHHPRRWGQSKYGWQRLVKGFLDLLTVTFLTQYRQRPMHMLGLPGLVALVVGVAIGLLLTFEKLINGAAIGTRPLLLLAVLLVVIGTQFFGLGLLGELLAHGSNAPGLPTATGEPVPLDPAIRDSLGLDADRHDLAERAP